MARKGFDAMSKQKLPNRITAWSFSRWDMYGGEKGCPRKAFYRIVKKMKEPSNKAMDRGSDIHKDGENAIKARRLIIPESFQKVKKTVAKLHRLGAEVELEFALNSAWGPATGKPKGAGIGGWFSKDVWLRVKTDVLAFLDKGRVAGVVDWKTGRYKPGNPSYDLQLHLYGATVLSLYPKVEEVETKLSFTDHGKEVIKIYTRDQLKEMKEGWEHRVKPMLADRKFAPRPGHYCTYCYFSRSHGGPCKF